MTARKAFAIVVFWSLVGGLLGGTMGAMLGWFAPDYYRAVLRNSVDGQLNPVQVGIGLGVTQGLAVGLGVALSGLAFVTWREQRSICDNATQDPVCQIRRPRRWVRFALWGAGICLTIVMFTTVAFTYGGIVGQQLLYARWTDEKLEKIAATLDTENFPNVRAEYSSAAQVYLTGTVTDEARLASLRDKLVLAFGTDEAEEMLWRVDVAQ